MFLVNNDDIADALLGMVIEKLGIKHRSILQLRIRDPEESQRWLQPDLPLFAQHVDEKTELVCEPQVIIMTPELLAELPEDPLLLNLIYSHCKRVVQACMWPVAERCAVELAALQIHADHGDYDQERHSKTFLENIDPMSFMPMSLAKLIDPKYWQQRVFSVYRRHPSMSQAVAKYRYVVRIASTAYFGASIIDDLQVATEHVVAGVTGDGIIIMHQRSYEALKFIAWYEVAQVHGNGRQITLTYQDETQTPTILTGRNIPQLHRLIYSMYQFYVPGMQIVRPPPREFSVLSDMRTEIIKTLYVKKCLSYDHDFNTTVFEPFDQSAERDVDLETFTIPENFDRLGVNLLSEAVSEGIFYEIPREKLAGRGAYAFRHNWHVRHFNIVPFAGMENEHMPYLLNILYCCPELEDINIGKGSKLGDKFAISLAEKINASLQKGEQIAILYTKHEDPDQAMDEEDPAQRTGENPICAEINQVMPYSFFCGFTIRGNKITQKGVTALLYAIQNATNYWGTQATALEPLQIGLEDVKVNDACAGIINQIGSVRNISRLILRKTKISTRMIEECIQTAVEGNRLKELDISESAIKKDDLMSVVLPALAPAAKTLTSIHFQFFGLTAKDAKFIDFLEQLEVLEEFDVGDNKTLGVDDARAMLEALAESKSVETLKMINLVRSGITAPAVDSLGSTLEKFPNLTALYLDTTVPTGSVELLHT